MEKHSHKLQNLFSFISLIALSMLVLSCADDNKKDLTGLITSFKVKVNNEVFEGNIDEDACQISFQGIKNLNAITDVEYQLREGASIYPDPKIRLTQWQTEERFIDCPFLLWIRQFQLVQCPDIFPPSFPTFPNSHFGNRCVLSILHFH